MRVKTLVIVFALAFSAISCGNSNASNTEGEENSASQTDMKLSNSASSANEEGKVVHLTTETFKQLVFNYDVNKEWKYEGSKPCIIDFYADWCGPCKRVAPILEELAQEYAGQIIVYKVNTDEQQELASAFGIRSIPSLLFVPVEGQPQMAQGALPKESFVNAINDVLLKK